MWRNSSYGVVTYPLFVLTGEVLGATIELNVSTLVFEIESDFILRHWGEHRVGLKLSSILLARRVDNVVLTCSQTVGPGTRVL